MFGIMSAVIEGEMVNRELGGLYVMKYFSIIPCKGSEKEQIVVSV